MNSIKSDPIYFAVFGDVHGAHNILVKKINVISEKIGTELSFVLQIGDFEPIRNNEDLLSMAAPSKYKRLGDFQNYFTGNSKFPCEVIFIGGNHEPYGFLDQYPNGGRIINNCTYLGRAGMISRKNINIAGLTGIYNERFYSQPHPKLSEINRTKNKYYTYFNMDDVNKVLNLNKIDIILLHEWPDGIILEKDKELLKEQLLKLRFINLANKPARELIDHLKPKWVFCGHMHYPYSQKIKHDDDVTTNIRCLDKIDCDKTFSVFYYIKGKFKEIHLD